ncbi:DUF4198 domain-containing protein [Mucilaginibacter sp. RS28]|uniref:DUF4198 domain-containing protein n=1 Tax=Mucilaginibacter straminoryzae TaxID=2932774 RepID=A0A9X1X043_9SPHI|nr:DUF4198 domain-containing protein [Mucilaginibacter straminoryzae]MCJ8208176.1 DUF4198 domain-containing protein [Mucilaginibacter straminoryzae]
MKRILFAAILLGFFNQAFAQADYFLLPEDFYPHKGEALNLHLLNGSSISKAQEQKYDVKNNTKFFISEGSKTIDITASGKPATIPVLTYQLQNQGLALISANQKTIDEVSKREFGDYLADNGLDKVADELKSFQRIYRIRSNSFMKTLVAVDKNGGNVNEKQLKDDFEIILKQNPYKLNYGDDITAVVYLQGKPIKAAKVTLVIRTPRGVEFPQNLNTNDAGEIFFKLTREGTYLLKSINMVLSKDQEAADFDNWETTFTFAFSSSNTMPNTYKEFGLGDKH